MDDLLVELRQQGSVIFSVRVQPNAITTCFKEPLADGTLRIALHAPAEHGKANRALCAFLADAFFVPLHTVDLLAGQSSRMKIVRIKANSQ